MPLYDIGTVAMDGGRVLRTATPCIAAVPFSMQLNLANNKIGNAGANELAKALAANSTLTTVYFA